MECNKDEAIRAREIAERKMRINDFDGAKKFALKSQQLYPTLDNISMLLAVCEVHCSAQHKKIGSDVDWYDVLQLEKMADEVTIKKQYRKLALLLHPDKNKFAGAEAAFKLVGEANRVLSDMATRSVFDLKVKAFMKTSVLKSKPRFHPSSGGSFFNKHQNSQPPVNISANQQSMATGPQKKSQTSYQGSVNSSNTNSTKPESFSNKGNSGSFHMGSEATRTAADVNLGTDRHSARRSMPKPPTNTGFPVSGSKPKFEDVDGVRLDAQKSCAKTEPRKLVLGLMATTSISRGKKRERPEVADSCHRQNSNGVVEPEVEWDKSYSNGNYDVREPCQRKINISHAESLKMQDTGHFNTKNQNGDGINSGVKDEVGINRGVKDGDEDASVTSMNGVEVNTRHYNGTSHEERLPHKKSKSNSGSGGNLVKEDVGEFKEKDSEIKPDTSPDHKCPEPEFSDFDKGKEKNCFDVDQIWAVYDSVDAMPRFYARLRKVLATDFKLQITWLEPDKRGKSYRKSVDEGLPIGCGVFKHGATEITTQHLMFSHRMVFELRTKDKQSSVVIYPRASEIWALFRNWDISCANDSETHKPYKFEFVMVLSDFDPKEGVKVAYLKKLEGFVSLFRRVTKDEGSFSCLIPPSNLFQFSHRIPYFQMSGTERDDVPEGSYELDTASLPVNIFKLDDVNDAKVGIEGKEDLSTNDISFKHNTVCFENQKTAFGAAGRNYTSKKQSVDDSKHDLTDVRSTKAFLNKGGSYQESGAAASNQGNDCVEVTPKIPTTAIRRSPRGLSSKKQ